MGQRTSKFSRPFAVVRSVKFPDMLFATCTVFRVDLMRGQLEEEFLCRYSMWKANNPGVESVTLRGEKEMQAFVISGPQASINTFVKITHDLLAWEEINLDLSHSSCKHSKSPISDSSASAGSVSSASPS